MNTYSFCTSTYIEGSNTLIKLSQILKSWGKCGCILMESTLLEKFKKQFGPFIKKGLSHIPFNGECTLEEINRVNKIVLKTKSQYIIAVGGGKALDTGKAAANKTNLRCITVPTSAATSAASTALSAIYKQSGISSHYMLFDKSPDIVIVDFSLLISAPIRLLASGMADSLAKYYESMAFSQGRSDSSFVNMALKTTKIIYNNIFNLGFKAYEDNKQKYISHEFKEIVRTNIMLAGLVGGIGGEGCRACASHSINNAFTRLVDTKKFLHGEMVGYGNLVQLALDHKLKEIIKLKQFYKKLNLPYSFKFFNIAPTKHQKEIVLKHALSKKETLKNMPKKISKQELAKIIFSF
ncbi:iron-containing alcohol dehydrogenase [bacterium]